MSRHWTYRDFLPADDLDQGDILEPTAELQAIFRDVHPHFMNPKYLSFMVITQSCDLVRRKGSCSAKYISLSVVRSLDSVIHDLLDATCMPLVPGVYLQETKGKARELLERILNQNEHQLGIFYLHPDIDSVGIGEAAVVLMRVHVTLRSSHYEVLQRARRGSLDPEFRNKFAWLMGNLYSRIGTPDWGDKPDGKKIMADLIKQILSSGGSASPVWIRQELYEAAKGKVNMETLTKENVVDTLAKFQPPPMRNTLIDVVTEIMMDVMPFGFVDEAVERRFRQRLNNSNELTTVLKRTERG